MFCTRLGYMTLLLGALECMAISPAMADSGADASDIAKNDGEIVVTALRRDSTIHNTPLAISAVTNETLLNTGSTSISDIARFAPSMRIQDVGPGQRRLSLRGILSAGEPTVGLYYDETPVAGSPGIGSDSGGRMPDFSLFDVDRVEVLRGPQGTLYGASAMSGAVRVIFAKPKFDVEAAADATITDSTGGGMGYLVNGMINLPVVDDLLAARLVVYRRNSNGYIDSVSLGKKNINDNEVNGGRLMLRFTPTPDVTIDGSILLENTNAASYGWNPSVGRYKTADRVLLPYKDRSRVYNLTGQWDLGPVTLTGVTSYQQRDFKYTNGDDTVLVIIQRNPAGCQRIFNGGAACNPGQLASFYTYMDSLIPVAFQIPGKTRASSHELRLSSNGDHWLNWTVGAFLEDRKNHVDSQTLRADATTGRVLSPEQQVYHRYVDDRYRQQAGFGEVAVKATDSLTLTAGARYFHYKRTVQGATDLPYPILAASIRPPWKVEGKQNGWLFKFNGEYRFSSNVMAYALVAQGYRPGGANQTIGLPDRLIPYEADKLWNYEAGVKTALFNGKLHIDTAIFQIDWSNMQVSGQTPDAFYTYITNVGHARVRGGEIEINARPTGEVNLFANATYLNAELTTDQINDYIVAAGRKGDRLPFIPRFAGAAGAEITKPLTSTLNIYARLDANYVGKSYSEIRPTNPYRVALGDYVLTNFRIGVEAPDGGWGAYLFANNIFNTVAINRGVNSALPNTYTVTSASPRTVGLNLRYRM